MIYWFIGPPAAGKGTQAKRLADRLGIPFFSVGALLREQSHNDRELAERIGRGELVDNDTFRRVLASIATTNHQSLVVDGAIRSPGQVPIVFKHWPENDSVVIELTLPDDEIIHRATRRLEGSLRRDDDDVAVVKRRIALYRQHREAIARELKMRSIRHVTVDGSGDVDEVSRRIAETV